MTPFFALLWAVTGLAALTITAITILYLAGVRTTTGKTARKAASK